MQLKNTNQAVQQNGVKMLTYAHAGSGKTFGCSTLPKPLILSAEGGLLSLSQFDLPYIEISDMSSLFDAYQFVKESADAKNFDTVVVDSISEVAEVVLANEKKNTKDPRQAYGALQDMMSDIIRSFRDLPEKHVYMTAKVDRVQDETGRLLYAPSMPGTKLGQQLPYFFDEVFALRVEKDAEGLQHRAVLTNTDGIWSAKDRSGKLDQWEAPDFGAIINKIMGA